MKQRVCRAVFTLGNRDFPGISPDFSPTKNCRAATAAYWTGQNFPRTRPERLPGKDDYTSANEPITKAASHSTTTAAGLPNPARTNRWLR